MKTIVLSSAPSRTAAMRYISQAPDGYVFQLREPTRSLEQNALIHAALTDISHQVEWMGKWFSVEVWKRLCMASWLRENGEQPTLIPALDGNGFDIIFERTSKLTVNQCSEFLEWCFAFGAENNVKFRDRDLGYGQKQQSL